MQFIAFVWPNNSVAGLWLFACQSVTSFQEIELFLSICVESNFEYALWSKETIELVLSHWIGPHSLLL